MGEIKSTLDLVMERTRHLSLSAEEKEEQQREDFARRLQGFLQQYADGALTTDALWDRMAALETETGVSDRKLSVAAVIQRIDPGPRQRPLAGAAGSPGAGHGPPPARDPCSP